jgi:hypothetical protein
MNAAGLAGNLSVDIQSITIANFSLTGALKLQLNTTTTAVQTSLVVGGQTLSLDVPPGPYIRLAGIGIQATIGGNTISGNFFFDQRHNENNDAITRLAISNGQVTVAGNTLNHLEGGLVIKPTGIAGVITGDISLGGAGVTVGGSGGFRINNTGGAVDVIIKFVA